VRPNLQAKAIFFDMTSEIKYKTMRPCFGLGYGSYRLPWAFAPGNGALAYLMADGRKQAGATAGVEEGNSMLHGSAALKIAQ